MGAQPSFFSVARLSKWALLGAAAGLCSMPLQASDFYKLTIVAESSTQAGPNWRILGPGTGINESGLVAWRADRFVAGAFEQGIFAGDGAPPSTPGAPGAPIAIGSLQVQGPISASQGQVAYLAVGIGSDPNTVRLWDRLTGSTVTLFACGDPPNNPLPCPGINSGASENARFTRLINNNPQVWQIIQSDGSALFGAALPSAFANSNSTHVISRNGLNAAGYGRNTTVSPPTAVIGALDSSIPGLFGTTTLGPLDEWQIQGVSANNLGNIAFVSFKGSLPNARAFVGVVNPRSGNSNLIRVADTSDGRFQDFHGSDGPAINNLNEVAFLAALPTSAGRIPFVGDVSGQTPRQVAALNEIIPDSNGAVFAGVQQYGVSAQALNDKGSFAFNAFIRRGSTLLPAVIRADPVEGVSPGNPIMPDAGSPLPAGWRFPLRCVVPTFCRVVSDGTPRPRTPRRYIDPPLAVGYAYDVQGGPNFASVYIPAALPNGDETFQVEFGNGQTAPLRAGEEFDFTASIPGGVSSFRITGIDTTEALDPANPTAFVTGLTFATDASTDYTVTMVPIVIDPDDLDRDGVPNPADLCPNTAPGAPVDSSGCSADQRDSDGDGVVDSQDQCPATPRGSPVNASGCSAPQLDADGDGVPNATDACPNTMPGATVDPSGCSASQRDADGDGVNDAIDQCPGTPAGVAVNAAGCSASQLDSDGDGVKDDVDACPGTAPGTAVDSRGCPLPPPPSQTCDVNGDRFIDYRDIALIVLGVGRPITGASDPRDANRDGRITLNDVALCTKRCDRKLCLPPR
jgi:hypothetical protein